MENEGFREMPKYSMSQCRVCLAWVMNDPCSKRLHCGSLTHRAMVLWVQPGKRSWASCLQEASAPAPSTEPAAAIAPEKKEKQKKKKRDKPEAGEKKQNKRKKEESGLGEDWLESETVSFQEFRRVTQ